MRRLLASLGLFAVLLIGLALVAGTWTSGTAVGEDKGKATPTEGAKPTETPEPPKDLDGDTVPDDVDSDDDGDGVPDEEDNCPAHPNADQLDTDGDKHGDACDEADKDSDGDTVPDDVDEDDDDDGVGDKDDNCPYEANADQANIDGDEHGDACDKDDDGDGAPDDEEKEYGSDPDNPNTDKDGCTDGQEMGPDENKGGQRDPTNDYDYFDPSHDGKIRALDIAMVVDQYFIDEGDPKYDADTDRSFLGPDPWDLGKPNGQHRADDIAHEVKQYYHDCA